MTGERKPSKAQIVLLQEAAAGRCWAVRSYKPAQIAVANGWLTWGNDDPYGGPLDLTGSGRAALTQGGRDDG